MAPAAPADDAEFLRRVSLDLTGKIPTAGEVREFLDDPQADKRRRLVDRLLDSPAYVAHFTTIEMRLMIPEAESSSRLQLSRRRSRPGSASRSPRMSASDRSSVRS